MRRVPFDVLRAAAIGCVALVLLALNGCGEPEPRRIGFIGGLSGRGSDLGVAGRNGAQIAVDQVNASGGLVGRPVELIMRDDGQQAEQAARAVSELLAAKVEVIIGPMTSGMAEVILPLTASSGVAVVSPTVTSSIFAGRDDHFFRVVATTREYAAASARYLFEARGARRVAVILERGNEAFTVDWVKHFSKVFTDLGGTVVHSETFLSVQEESLREPVARLLAARPDAVMIAASAIDMARICQLVRRLDGKVTLMGTNWAATEDLVSVGGPAMEGVLVPQFFDRDDARPRYAAFRAAYLDRFGEQPGYASVAAYDATRLALDALARAGSGMRVARMLANTEFDGLQQRVKLDRWGDSQRDVFMTSIRGGRFRLEAKLASSTP